MTGTSTQATIAVAAPSYAKRRARALIGWLPEQEGALWIAGREMQDAPNPTHLALCQKARQVVAARPPGLDQTNLVIPCPSELQEHINAFRAHPWGAQVIADAGEPMLVDLTRVRAVQAVIHVDDAIKRVESIAKDDLAAIARVTLPIPPAEFPELTVGYDEIRQTHQVSSPNPNLRVLGHIRGRAPGPGGVQIPFLGFAVVQTDSYMCVGSVNGRYFLRDGYHRAYGFLQAGITHVPALVRGYNNIAEAKLPPTIMPMEEFMGDRPPTLPDYLDHTVGVDTSAPITTKMIVVQALELNPLG